tara:strand:+ start:299 stop:553 length:255 start_codon:yes stop_codon:yes gene_type:complete
MTKPRYVELRYTATATFDLKEHDINPNELENVWFKYGYAHIELKSGEKKSGLEYELDLHEVDYKWHDDLQVYDKNYNELEVDWI